MASLAENTFYIAVGVAEGVRQSAKASAFATYGFAQANLAAYKTAIAAADVAYFTAVTAALNTEAGTLGNIGQTGPFGGLWAAPALSS